MSMALLALLALLSCKGCSACGPAFPDNSQNNNSTPPPERDTVADDTGEGPPPPCDVPEVEPNDTRSEAQELPMEAWACGTIATQNDADVFRFEVPEAGWLKVWARGADIGSNADLQLVLADSDDRITGYSVHQPNSTDPLLIVPVDEPLSLYAAVSDQFSGYGDDEIWRLIASMTKPPVSWNAEEAEGLDVGDNDTLATGESVESGDRVLGTVASGDDRDWYLVSLPAGIKATIEAKIEAFDYGSPLHAHIYIYDPDGNKKKGKQDATGDPELSYSTSDGGDWAVLVKSASGSGSPLYWYVLDLTVSLETDSGESDTGG